MLNTDLVHRISVSCAKYTLLFRFFYVTSSQCLKIALSFVYDISHNLHFRLGSTYLLISSQQFLYTDKYVAKLKLLLSVNLLFEITAL